MHLLKDFVYRLKLPNRGASVYIGLCLSRFAMPRIQHNDRMLLRGSGHRIGRIRLCPGDRSPDTDRADRKHPDQKRAPPENFSVLSFQIYHLSSLLLVLQYELRRENMSEYASY